MTGMPDVERNEDFWENLGIAFSVPSEDDYDEILEFYLREFVPDEPVFRSLDLLGGTWWVDRYVHNVILEDIMKSSLRSPTSIVARNKDGRIVGLRLGKIYESTSPVPAETSFQWAITFPFYVPKRLVALGLVQRYIDMFDYGIDKAFDQLEGASKIYFGQALCAAKEMRGKGLGHELVRRSHQIAVDNGCQYAYLLASGIFSQAIFAKAGYKVLKEFLYEDMLDPYGKPIIWDHREHKITQLVYKKF